MYLGRFYLWGFTLGPPYWRSVAHFGGQRANLPESTLPVGSQGLLRTAPSYPPKFGDCPVYPDITSSIAEIEIEAKRQTFAVWCAIVRCLC